MAIIFEALEVALGENWELALHVVRAPQEAPFEANEQIQKPLF